jgi:hypothetical protein
VQAAVGPGGGGVGDGDAVGDGDTEGDGDGDGDEEGAGDGTVPVIVTSAGAEVRPVGSVAR